MSRRRTQALVSAFTCSTPKLCIDLESATVLYICVRYACSIIVCMISSRFVIQNPSCHHIVFPMTPGLRQAARPPRRPPRPFRRGVMKDQPSNTLPRTPITIAGRPGGCAAL
ncbi:hypothetical protein FIBSPDRAFT_290033 [Athelia psychrophila]|uniref:Uncharacterized protein n=1 Tax=Athelia psychrophila TaxID=1759441 RepID=A0A167XHY9_9AGAM|nr:hypothetical protein FIBSPDRAFT_290033 [Fibularhizoctonia sp. CBS 109695]